MVEWVECDVHPTVLVLLNIMLIVKVSSRAGAIAKSDDKKLKLS